MAKQWWFSFVFTVMLSTFGVAQTLLNSFEIPLQRPNNAQSMWVGVNESNQEITTFVSDKQKVTAIQFNRAVFFKDTLSTTPPDKNLGTMVGMGFAENQHPVLFYTSEDYRIIQSLLFDFNRRATVRRTYQMPLQSENLLYYFSDRNAFSVLTVVKGKDHLKWYYFKDNALEVMLINLEEVAQRFKEKSSQTLQQYLELYPLERVDSNVFNPIFNSCNKSKFYVHDQGLTFTFDHRKDATQMIVVNKENETIDIFQHSSPKMQDQNFDLNSYLIDGFLFQIAANKKELALSVKNLNTKEIVKTYRVSDDQPIDFANSDLMLLMDYQAPKTFKKTKAFLGALSGSDLGISVHKINSQYHVQVGGRKWVMSSADYFMGVLSAVANTGDWGTDFNNVKVVYFDTLLDKEFNFVKRDELRFAQDYVSFFVEDEKITFLAPTVYYQGGLLMAYYDRKEQRVILRRFEDDLY